jgi:hypothetical protein
VLPDTAQSFSRNLIHSRVNPVPKLEEEEEDYGPWQPCWISNQHQKHKSGIGPSNEHFWQIWLKSVQRFQRRRFKCEKLTDGRTLTHDKSSHGL